MVIFSINNIIRYFIKHPLTIFIFQKNKIILQIFRYLFWNYKLFKSKLSNPCENFKFEENCKLLFQNSKFVKLVFPFFYLTQDNAVRKRKVDHFTFQWTHLLQIYDYQPFRTLCSTFSCDESSFNC